MADNWVAKDGAGGNLTFKSKELAGGVHVSQSIPSGPDGLPYAVGNPMPTQIVPRFPGTAVGGSTNGPGRGLNVKVGGRFNVTVYGVGGPFVGSFTLDRRFGGDATWYPVSWPDGAPAMFTGPLSTTLDEPEDGVEYSINVVSLSSGSLGWRISQ